MNEPVIEHHKYNSEIKVAKGDLIVLHDPDRDAILMAKSNGNELLGDVVVISAEIGWLFGRIPLVQAKESMENNQDIIVAERSMRRILMEADRHFETAFYTHALVIRPVNSEVDKPTHPYRSLEINTRLRNWLHRRRRVMHIGKAKGLFVGYHEGCDGVYIKLYGKSDTNHSVLEVMTGKKDKGPRQFTQSPRGISDDGYLPLSEVQCT